MIIRGFEVGKWCPGEASILGHEVLYLLVYKDVLI
jgi:hypothetical protein